MFEARDSTSAVIPPLEVDEFSRLLTNFKAVLRSIVRSVHLPSTVRVLPLASHSGISGGIYQVQAQPTRAWQLTPWVAEATDQI